MGNKTNNCSKRMMQVLPKNEKNLIIPDIEYLKKIFIKSGGFISHIAKDLKVSVNTIYNWMEKSDELTLHLRQIRESHLDLAEFKLIEKIKIGNLGAICFYLKCQGKHRGWIERHEITGGDGKDLNIGVVILPELQIIKITEEQINLDSNLKNNNQLTE